MEEKELKILLKAWGRYWRMIENNYPHTSIADPTTTVILVAGRVAQSRVPIQDPPDDVMRLHAQMELLTNMGSVYAESISFVRMYYLSGRPVKEVSEAMGFKTRKGSELLRQGHMLLRVALSD